MRPEDRLLTNKEIKRLKVDIVNKDAFYHPLLGGKLELDLTRVLEAQDAKVAELTRKELVEWIQKYIDENNIYQVEFGHYEPPLNTKWIPLKTYRVNLKEAL